MEKKGRRQSFKPDKSPILLISHYSKCMERKGEKRRQTHRRSQRERKKEKKFNEKTEH